MLLKSINNEIDYQQALQRLEVIFDAAGASEEGVELECLGMLIEQYEDENLPIN